MELHGIPPRCRSSISSVRPAAAVAESAGSLTRACRLLPRGPGLAGAAVILRSVPATVIVGAQWGDEGKGKIVDLLAQDSDLVCRYQGGPNAGHTIVVDGETVQDPPDPVGDPRRQGVA